MTISGILRTAGPYIGNNTTTVFGFTFKVFATDQLVVVKLNTSTSVETTLTLITDYTVTLNGNQNSNPGGSVTLPAVLATGYNLTLTSSVANLQPTDLTNQGGFYPEVITDALDRATIQIQQMSDDVTRSIKAPLSDDLLTMDMTLPVVSDRINKILAFGATGMPTAVAQSPSSITGNTTIVGTLGVTGATTLSSTLGVTGAATLASVGVTGAATVGTTLGVTGATTLSSTLDATGNFAVNTNKFTVAASSGDTLAAGTFTATGGVAAASLTSKIQPITATLAASNALTITLNPTILDFRSATIGSGAVTSLVVANAISITIPSGATLGTVNLQPSRLVVLCFNNSGTPILAVTNISGGLNCDETVPITTTLISAGSTTATIAYGSVGIGTNTAFRVVGYIESTQATAGTWATAPSTIQGMGGQALTAMSSLGYGQIYTNVSRSLSTTYYNTTGKPLFLSVSITNATIASDSLNLYINGVSVQNTLGYGASWTYSLTAIIPSGSSYSVTDAQAGTIARWYELR